MKTEARASGGGAGLVPAAFSPRADIPRGEGAGRPSPGQKLPRPDSGSTGAASAWASRPRPASPFGGRNSGARVPVKQRGRAGKGRRLVPPDERGGWVMTSEDEAGVGLVADVRREG